MHDMPPRMRNDTLASPTSTEPGSAVDPGRTETPVRPGWLRTHLPTVLALASTLAAFPASLGRKCRALLRDTASIVSGVLALLWSRARSSPVTLIVVAVNLVLYLVVEARGGEKAVTRFFLDCATNYPRVLAGEWWRVFTMGWAHENWDHVWGNCESILICGLLLEPRMRSARFAFLFGLTTVASGLANVFLQNACCAGASGALFGLEGALLAYPAFVAPGPSLLVWLWNCNEVVGGIQFDIPRLAYAGHMAGLLSGLLIAALMRRDGEPIGSRFRCRRFALASFAVCGLSLTLGSDPRWPLKMKANQAALHTQPAEQRLAECSWEEIEASANPESPAEANMLAEAADFHYDRAEYTQARALLLRAAPALRDARTFRNLGILQWMTGHTNDKAAAASFDLALELEPESSENLWAIAMLSLWSDDSTIFRPIQAMIRAEESVRLDGDKSPEHLLTLAWVRFAFGDRREAVRTVRKALALGPEDPEDYQQALIDMARSSDPWATMAIRDRWLQSGGG